MKRPQGGSLTDESAQLTTPPMNGRKGLARFDQYRHKRCTAFCDKQVNQ